MPTEEQRRRVADHILEDLLDRRGIKHELGPIKRGDPQVWNEIRDAIGERAWTAIEREQRGPRP